MATASKQGSEKDRFIAPAIPIKQWMTPAPHSIGKDQPLAVAHRIMRDNGLRHLPVLEHGRLVGMLSERDLFFLESISDVDPEKETVEQGMSQDVYCVPPEARVREVIAEMKKHRYGSAVVVDRGKVVGVFTTTNALELLSTFLGGDA
jgi:acetoin utilization protein AcuB